MLSANPLQKCVSHSVWGNGSHPDTLSIVGHRLTVQERTVSVIRYKRDSLHFVLYAIGYQVSFFFVILDFFTGAGVYLHPKVSKFSRRSNAFLIDIPMAVIAPCCHILPVRSLCWSGGYNDKACCPQQFRALHIRVLSWLPNAMPKGMKKLLRAGGVGARGDHKIELVSKANRIPLRSATPAPDAQNASPLIPDRIDGLGAGCGVCPSKSGGRSGQLGRGEFGLHQTAGNLKCH